MEIGDLERQIDEFISRSGNTPALQSLISEGNLDVVKYMPAAYLENVLARGQLYAAERAGFTWGDAVYVAPLSCPLTTMMYRSSSAGCCACATSPASSAGGRSDIPARDRPVAGLLLADPAGTTGGRFCMVSFGPLAS